MGAFENTLILFASDNGASAEIMVRGDGHDSAAPLGSAATFLCLGPGWSSSSNTPFRRHKTWVHEGGIATPLIAHWPAGIKGRGELRHTAAHLVDIVPTVLELAGAKKPATIKGLPVPPAPGRSLAPALAKDVAIARDFLWWEHEGNRAIRVGDWKLVALKNGGWELYDLSRDRGEQNNLAAAPPEKVSELELQWTRPHGGDEEARPHRSAAGRRRAEAGQGAAEPEVSGLRRRPPKWHRSCLRAQWPATVCSATLACSSRIHRREIPVSQQHSPCLLGVGKLTSRDCATQFRRHATARTSIPQPT